MFNDIRLPRLAPIVARVILFGAAFTIVSIAGSSLMLWSDTVVLATIFGVIFVGVSGVMLAANLHHLSDQE